jgi:hypothetical protein
MWRVKSWKPTDLREPLSRAATPIFSLELSLLEISFTIILWRWKMIHRFGVLFYNWLREKLFSSTIIHFEIFIAMWLGRYSFFREILVYWRCLVLLLSLPWHDLICWKCWWVVWKISLIILFLRNVRRSNGTFQGCSRIVSNAERWHELIRKVVSAEHWLRFIEIGCLPWIQGPFLISGRVVVNFDPKLLK